MSRERAVDLAGPGVILAWYAIATSCSAIGCDEPAEALLVAQLPDGRLVVAAHCAGHIRALRILTEDRA